MTQGAAKVCHICGKNVSNIKRVKDPAGHYYCEPCYQTASNGATPIAAAAAATAPAASASSDDLMLKDEPKPKPPAPAEDVLDFKEPPPTRAKPQRVAAQVTEKPQASPPADVQLPERCPNCGLPVLTKSVYCVGCNRDMTKLDKLARIMADGAKQDTAQKVGKVAGRVIGAILIVIVVIIVGLGVLGQFSSFFKAGDAFASYPTSRDALLRTFLQHVNGGSDKDIDAAYKLVSQRETGITKTGEVEVRNAIKGLRDKLINENGADWFGKTQIVIPPPDKYLGDEIFAEIQIGKNTYHIGLQAQIGTEQAAVERMKSLDARTVYRENGKVHWGIGEVKEHQLVDPVEAKRFRPGSDADHPDAQIWIPPG